MTTFIFSGSYKLSGRIDSFPKFAPHEINTKNSSWLSPRKIEHAVISIKEKGGGQCIRIILYAIEKIKEEKA